MRNSSRQIIVVAAMLFALSCPIGEAGATSFSVSLDTPSLNSMPGVLIFDFIGGAPPDNFVLLNTPFGGNGTTGGVLSMTGNVSAVLGGWRFDSAPGFFSDELQLAYTFGTMLSFSFSTSDNPVDTLPAGFSFFIFQCDPDTPDTCNLIPLVTTDDPTGADTLFLYTIGQGPPDVFDPGQDVTITVTPVTSAPEPGSLALFAIGLVALAWRRMIRLASFRVRRLPIAPRSL